MVELPAVLTAEQLYIIEKIVNVELRKYTAAYNEALAKVNAMLKEFETLDTEALANLVSLNKTLSELQKSQVLAILQGPKHGFTYFQ